MAPSKVIRIDDQVWSELQKRARPLEDTPNSVLRRALGLPDEDGDDNGVDSRIGVLLDQLQKRTGEPPQVHKVKKNYSLLSKADEVIAYIRPQKRGLRIGVSKWLAEDAGLQGWERERNDGFFGGPGVRWNIKDGDDAAYQQAATLLEKLWRVGAQSQP